MRNRIRPFLNYDNRLKREGYMMPEIIPLQHQTILTETIRDVNDLKYGDDGGWVKLHRKFTEWEWYKNTNTKCVFLHLFLNANHKNSRFEGHEIKRGQVVTGRIKLAEELGMSEQEIRTTLAHLQHTGEIVKKSTSKFSIITICKYDSYQKMDYGINQQSTSNQPAINHKQECKNVRNIIYGDNFNKFWDLYPSRGGKKGSKQKALEKFSKLSEGEIKDVLIAVNHYANSSMAENGYVKDAFRWLTGDTWCEWKNPETKIIKQKQWEQHDVIAQ